MYEWTDEQRMIRDAVRQFVEAEIAPRRDEFEFGDTPPYDVLRKLYKSFGLDVMAASSSSVAWTGPRATAAAICWAATTRWPTPGRAPTPSRCR